MQRVIGMCGGSEVVARVRPSLIAVSSAGDGDVGVEFPVCGDVKRRDVNCCSFGRRSGDL